MVLSCPRRRAFVLAPALLAALARGAAAQTPTLPQEAVGPCAIPMLEAAAGRTTGMRATAALTRSFHSGLWTQLQADVRAIISAMPRISPGCALPSPAPAVVVVAWVGETPAGDRALLAAVVPRDGGEPYAARIPGLAGAAAGLYQLFVGDAETDALAAGYLSTPLEDPLDGQVPAVAARVLDPMLALAARTMEHDLRAKATATLDSARARARAAAAGWATLWRVDLPHARARVRIEMRASPVLTERDVTSASGALRDKLALVDVRYSTAGRSFAAALDRELRAHAAECAADAGGCLARLDPVLTQEYEDACPCTDEDRKAVQLVDGRFRALLLDLEGKPLEAELTVLNTPLRHASFGLLAGLTFGRTATHPNVKIDRGVYARDELDRQTVMVTVNRSFAAFDEKAIRITTAERHRWFVGAVLTPAFGVGGGYSFVPIRGLGINAGYAVVGTSTPAGGKTIGQVPADEDDPFSLGWAGGGWSACPTTSSDP
jgi:hypothetical protein